jgi:hypothetical protein
MCAVWGLVAFGAGLYAAARIMVPLLRWVTFFGKVIQTICSWSGPCSSGAHSDEAPWARAERSSMSWQRSRGIPAARPTAHRLRSACTQVAFCGVWTIDVEKQNQKKNDQADRSHAPRGNASIDAPRRPGRRASCHAFQRGAWERSCKGGLRVPDARIKATSVVPNTPHAPVLLPVPGRSSECGPEQARSYSQRCGADKCGARRWMHESRMQ